mmetsp:Transcript_117205/g.215609  ORF Transcript_117205/g.215609 Transcript_117205/m.215609 type:complete len:82 (+) Transcript_117205:1989-2234(+)
MDLALEFCFALHGVGCAIEADFVSATDSALEEDSALEAGHTLHCTSAGPGLGLAPGQHAAELPQACARRITAAAVLGPQLE